MTYALITGIQKIKLAGAEKRAFARWGNLYAQSAKMTYDPPMFLKLNSVISLAISLTGTLVMYYMSVRAGLSVADYYAFNTAYGMVSGAFLSLAGIALSAAQIRPILTMVQPFFDAVPEVSDGKQVIERLSGSIELNNVSFRYNENMPLILDDLSLKIRPGQYVAIVGRTGCGKSTLLRLLLGFEKPQKGAIYYDGKDLERIDLRSLRRRIGVVMQNGKLFQGDIYSNIVISAPWLSQQDAWEAAELTGHCRGYPQDAHGYEHGHIGGLRRHIRRAAPAADDCPRHRAEAQDFDVRRGDKRAGQHHTEKGVGVAGPAEVYPHCHCPPPVHHQTMRPHPRARSWKDRRGRDL